MPAITIQIPDSVADRLADVTEEEIQAAVVALLSEKPPKKKPFRVAEFLTGKPSGRTAQEINDYINELRDEWER